MIGFLERALHSSGVAFSLVWPYPFTIPLRARARAVTAACQRLVSSPLPSHFGEAAVIARTLLASSYPHDPGERWSAVSSFQIRYFRGAARPGEDRSESMVLREPVSDSAPDMPTRSRGHAAHSESRLRHVTKKQESSSPMASPESVSAAQMGDSRERNIRNRRKGCWVFMGGATRWLHFSAQDLGFSWENSILAG